MCIRDRYSQIGVVAPFLYRKEDGTYTPVVMNKESGKGVLFTSNSYNEIYMDYKEFETNNLSLIHISSPSWLMSTIGVLGSTLRILLLPTLRVNEHTFCSCLLYTSVTDVIKMTYKT